MLGRRELELMTPVDAESCATVIRGLLYLQHQDPEAPVTLYINSPGGEVQNGRTLCIATVYRRERIAQKARNP